MWPLASDTIGADDMDALADWLRTHPRLTQGSLVRAFEDAWAAWVGTEDTVMVTSGTAANFALMAVASRRVTAKPVRVGVSAVTWSTNVTPSLWLGHEVTVFDVDPKTLGIDTHQACEAIRQGKIDILFVTHLLGLNALTTELIQTAEDHGVILL